MPHVELVAATDTAGGVDGSMFADAVAEHPSDVVTVTPYEPAAKFETTAVLAPMFQVYVYGAVPFATVASTKPLFNPQVVAVGVAVTVGNAVVAIAPLAVAVHPFASVAVTV